MLLDILIMFAFMAVVGVIMTVLVFVAVKWQKKYTLAEKYRRAAIRYKAKIDAENDNIMTKEETIEYIKKHKLDEIVGIINEE